MNTYLQGFQPLEKSWKPGKWKKLFPDIEKLLNLEKAPKTWKNHEIFKNLNFHLSYCVVQFQFSYTKSFSSLQK